MALFVIGMLAALVLWVIVIGAILYGYYRLLRWAFTTIWRYLTRGSRIREVRLQVREAQLRAQEEALRTKEKQLEALMAREYQEWWERTLGLD